MACAADRRGAPVVGAMWLVELAGTQATAGMRGGDSSLDTIDSQVVLLAAAPLTARDDRGNPLEAELGRGRFASAPR
jgi:hypothetical protein